ncbi:MAG: VWA domain-containing protein [Candidatus Dormibacteria bacterium]
MLAYVLMQMRRRKYAVRFTNLALLNRVAPKRPSWRRHIAAGLFMLALATLCVSLTQPYLPVNKGVNRTTIMLALDVSGSMNATDVTPTRIEALKAAADDFIKSVPSDVNVGVVSFSNGASLDQSPTTDHLAAQQAVDTLNAYGGTAIGEAIFTCLDAVAKLPPSPDGSPAPARIVLMSDGATNTGRSNDTAAAAAQQKKIQVWTIAYGTLNGTITLPDGSTVPVPADRPALAAVASQTSGRFFTADSAQQIRQVYGDIGKSLGYKVEKTDISSYFVVGAFGLFVLAGLGSLLWTGRFP